MVSGHAYFPPPARRIRKRCLSACSGARGEEPPSQGRLRQHPLPVRAAGRKLGAGLRRNGRGAGVRPPGVARSPPHSASSGIPSGREREWSASLHWAFCSLGRGCHPRQKGGDTRQESRGESPPDRWVCVQLSKDHPNKS